MNNSITILSFSSRINGNCRRICDYLAGFHSSANVHFHRINSENFAPCAECDYECLKSGVVCPQLNEEQNQIMQDICESDLVYFVVPNYCGYPCANYFAFNERTVGYFNMDRERMNQYMDVPKRFIIISNSQVDNFTNAMRQQTNAEPDILYLQTRKYKKQSIAGDLLESNEAMADLMAYLTRESFTY